MKEAADFVTSIARAISAMTLYSEGHPALERAIDRVFDDLETLRREERTFEFTFLGDEIIFGRLPLKGLRRWGWGSRLAEVGIQRLQVEGPVEREELTAFLDDTFSRLTTGSPPPSAEARQLRSTNLIYGPVVLRGLEEEEEGGGDGGEDVATLGFDLREEVEGVEWLHRELGEGRGLQLLEAEAIVRSLSVAMHGDSSFLIPLLRLKRFDQYTTTHAMNVSVLAMALAEYIGLAPREVKTFGVAGMLHDLGKVRVPEEILNKPGKLTAEEREVMNSHTVEGARIILETERELDLAAVVAYEHHIRLDGGGYPSLHYPRPCHEASNLVHVCDVYDAFRTRRPYRDAWGQSEVLRYIEKGAGTEFEPHLARAFVKMMKTWDSRIAVVEEADQPLPIAGSPVAPPD